MRYLALLILFKLTLFADDPTRTVVSAPPVNARFQIIQSELAAKATFKLDRFAGRVWQFLSTPDGNVWSLMHVEGMPTKGIESVVPRFQIFSSGLALKFTYLLDTVSGSCWELAGSEKSNDAWQQVPDK